MVLTVVGAVTVDAVREGVEAVLGGWQAPAARPNRSIPPEVQLTEPRRQVVPLPGKTQADIVLGWPGMTRTEPDYVKASLTNTILGVFGMMGRLGKNVRDELGLAYYVYSRLEAGVGAGPWVAVAGINPASVEQAVGGILGEVQRLRDDAVPAGELADSQSFLTGSMPLRLETNEGIAHAVLDMERYELGLDYLERYAGLVDEVQVQDIQDMARKYLNPDVYALAVAGPADE
jgi:zinc protease